MPINLDVKRGKSIKYTYEGKQKIYFSDYYLKKFNLIVEIKSTYIYDLHKKRNIEKRKSTLNKGYNFLFIIDKNYNNFLRLLKIVN